MVVPSFSMVSYETHVGVVVGPTAGHELNPIGRVSARLCDTRHDRPYPDRGSMSIARVPDMPHIDSK